MSHHEAEIYTVSQLVRADYRRAEVFRKWGINYCCGGNLPLNLVCELQGLDEAAIVSDLENAVRTVQLPANLPYGEWPMDFLISYITHLHHHYLKTTLPGLLKLVQSFAAGHQQQYPYIETVSHHLGQLSNAVLEGIIAEEATLFPYLKRLNNIKERKESYGGLFVRTLKQPLVQEPGASHQRIRSLLTVLRETTDEYSFPDTVCTNHQVIYHNLKELDAQLTHYLYLEKEVLLPKAAAIEAELLLCQ